jgi:hypothetical protein
MATEGRTRIEKQAFALIVLRERSFRVEAGFTKYFEENKKINAKTEITAGFFIQVGGTCH